MNALPIITTHYIGHAFLSHSIYPKGWSAKIDGYIEMQEKHFPTATQVVVEAAVPLEDEDDYTRAENEAIWRNEQVQLQNDNRDYNAEQ